MIDVLLLHLNNRTFIAKVLREWMEIKLFVSDLVISKGFGRLSSVFDVAVSFASAIDDICFIWIHLFVPFLLLQIIRAVCVAQ